MYFTYLVTNFGFKRGQWLDDAPVGQWLNFQTNLQLMTGHNLHSCFSNHKILFYQLNKVIYIFLPN
jgi:hypothetical protein